MKDFKYPILRMFFDVDDVSCVFVEDVLKVYPNIKDKIKGKTWDIERLKPVYIAYEVMAVADLSDIVQEGE